MYTCARSAVTKGIDAGAMIHCLFRAAATEGIDARVIDSLSHTRSCVVIVDSVLGCVWRPLWLADKELAFRCLLYLRSVYR